MLLEKSGCAREATPSYSIETNIGIFETIDCIINYNFYKIKILFNILYCMPMRSLIIISKTQKIIHNRIQSSIKCL